jgi:hypothetical protein
MLAAIAGAVVLMLAGEKAVGKGLLLGTLFSAVNFIVMAQLLHRALSGSRKRSTAAALGSILFRFSLLAVPLVISLRTDAVHFIGVVIGLFMVQLTLLVDSYMRSRTPFTGNT